MELAGDQLLLDLAKKSGVGTIACQLVSSSLKVDELASEIS